MTKKSWFSCGQVILKKTLFLFYVYVHVCILPVCDTHRDQRGVNLQELELQVAECVCWELSPELWNQSQLS